ncbi:MAG: hypothetical protein QM499_00905 [Flavobacteriaceae bacterium]
MAITTPIYDPNSDQYYYENKEQWGNSMHITLENVIDNIIATKGNDSYFKHISRPAASIFGKQGMKRLNVDLINKDKAIAIQLSPNRTFPYPRYMTNWRRVSVLNKCEKLTVLNINNRPEIRDYLQDNEWGLLYDSDGNVLEASSFNAEVGECYQYECVQIIDDCTDDKFKNSWVKDNKKGSYFEFSEELVDEIIVIEFETAGLEGIADCDVKIPNILELTIENWIRCQLLKGKRNIPNSEWKTYYELYKLEKARARPHLANKITFQQILKSISLRYNQAKLY